MGNIRRLFIIGAGASDDAEMPVGDILLKTIIQAARGTELEEEAQSVINRLRIFFPKHDLINEWPTFEQYLDLGYTLNLIDQKKAEQYGFINGYDLQAATILYWYLFDKRNKQDIERITFARNFAKTINFQDRIISLNYDNFFETGMIYDNTSSNDWWTEYHDKYAEKIRPKLIKPHGSMDWMIINGDTPMYDNDRDGFARELYPTIKQFDREVVSVCTYFHDIKQVFKERHLPCIVPPMGLKGYVSPTEVIKVKENNPSEILRKDMICEEVYRAYTAIDQVTDEIWFIGTTLTIDPYLLNRIVANVVMKKQTIKIYVIDKSITNALNLAKKLGTLNYYKNGTFGNFIKEMHKGDIWELL